MRILLSILSCLFLTSLVEAGTINRVDMVFLGDGYTQEDIQNGNYSNQIGGFLEYMFSDSLLTDPFSRYKNYFAVNIVDIVSAESGADKPPLGIYRNTALGATYWTNNTAKALTVNEYAVKGVLRNLSLTPEMLYIIVNDDRYGGYGRDWAVFAGLNYNAYEIALHEQAHAFSGLGDEYGYTSGKNPNRNYEPSFVNITHNPDGKWDHWLGYKQEGIGTIDVYEGAFGYTEGSYRPSLNSKMKTLGRPFDAVAREKIILDIYKYVDPLDDWGKTSNKLWVDPIDDIICTEWFINDQLVAQNVLEFPLDNLPRGSYNIYVRAFDDTEWVRRDLNQLEQIVSWNMVVPEPQGIIFFLFVFLNTRKFR